MDAAVATPLRKRQLSVHIPKPRESRGSMAPAPAALEPVVSPTTRLFKDLYIVALFGFAKPTDLAAFRALLSTVARHPRFCSIQATDEGGGTPRWARTTVNVDDHIIVPSLDAGAVAADPAKAVEDYVASLSTLPMDFSRPLWEIHLLNFPTSSTVAATAVFRFHHSVGDGTSLISFLIASAQSADSPEAPPSVPPPGRRRTGQIYARPCPPLSAGVFALALWAWSCVVLAWNTVVDLVAFVATVLFLDDPDTPFKRAGHGEAVRSRRVVHRGLSLDDIKYIKNAMNCALADMMDSSTKGKDVSWGIRLGFMLLPLHIALHNDDPLEYIRKAKKAVDRKKSSLEVLFTHAVVGLTTKFLGLKVASLVFERMLSHTTISISSVMGTIEKIEVAGHPAVFIAPTTFGVPEALCLNFQSYMNTVRVVLAVDDTTIPDYHALLDDFTACLKIIRDAS
ncbi:hypothetical protein U9M48_035229 [Paspalum notatum var. saurae]|uniref:Diacylglycerol O-acyltransferase n=1 Tax=Paspalum notatum var. saurae TaxID=547442 RepID=A0AAQ3UGH2_PASNO